MSDPTGKSVESFGSAVSFRGGKVVVRTRPSLLADFMERSHSVSHFAKQGIIRDYDGTLTLKNDFWMFK